jgi:hypothetical protein
MNLRGRLRKLEEAAGQARTADSLGPFAGPEGAPAMLLKCLEIFRDSEANASNEDLAHDIELVRAYVAGGQYDAAFHEECVRNLRLITEALRAVAQAEGRRL